MLKYAGSRVSLGFQAVYKESPTTSAETQVTWVQPGQKIPGEKCNPLQYSWSKPTEEPCGLLHGSQKSHTWLNVWTVYTRATVSLVHKYCEEFSVFDAVVPSGINREGKATLWHLLGTLGYHSITNTNINTFHPSRKTSSICKGTGRFVGRHWPCVQNNVFKFQVWFLLNSKLVCYLPLCTNLCLILKQYQLYGCTTFYRLSWVPLDFQIRVLKLRVKGLSLSFIYLFNSPVHSSVSSHNTILIAYDCLEGPMQ